MAHVEHIHAVTLCINYTDYLSSTLVNRAHFEKWTIVTCPKDVETISFCEKEGLDVLVTDCLGPGAEEFDSAYSKATIINWALDALMPSGWVALLDADTLLPSNFRTRLNALDLYQRALYGLYGRKDCLTWKQFGIRMRREPWEDFIGYSNGIMGYLQLFHAGQPINRYPRKKYRVQMHDDVAFQRQFKAGLRRFLPMTSLHAGPPRENWAGRRSSVFIRSDEDDSPTTPSSEEPSGFKSGRGCSDQGWTVVVGFDESWEPDDPLCLDKIVLVDWFGITGKCNCSLLDADNSQRLKRLRSRFPDQRLEILCAEAETLKRFFRSQKVSVLELNFEPDAGGLSRLCEIIRASEQSAMLVTGHFFGYPEWLDSTAAIALAFGVPDALESGGRWRKTIVPHTLPVLLESPVRVDCVGVDVGIVCTVFNEEDVQALIIASHLYSLPIAAALLVDGAPTLDLVLRALDVAPIELPLSGVRGESRELAVCLTCLQSPFRRSIYLDLSFNWPDPDGVNDALSETGRCVLSIDDTTENPAEWAHFVWDERDGFPGLWLDKIEECRTAANERQVPNGVMKHQLSHLITSVRTCPPVADEILNECVGRSNVKGSGVSMDPADTFLTWATAGSGSVLTDTVSHWGIKTCRLVVIDCGLAAREKQELGLFLAEKFSDACLVSADLPHTALRELDGVLSWLRREAMVQPAIHRFIAIHPYSLPVPGADLYKLYRPKDSVAVEIVPQRVELSGTREFAASPVMLQASFLKSTQHVSLPDSCNSLPEWATLAAGHVALPVCFYPRGTLGWRAPDLAKVNVSQAES